VQSGKTAHYAGVINRAADAGYRVIVVLAGMHNILRKQTQDRMEEDFLGYDTDPRSFTETGRRKAIGVGEINPRLIVDSLTSAMLNGDFSQKVADQANFAPLNQPCLLVVKKNAKVLENLNRWINRLPDELRIAPLLVIDDEADQASVDTGDQPLLPDGTFDEDYDPKRVNGQIRILLNSFGRSAYACVTFCRCPPGCLQTSRAIPRQYPRFDFGRRCRNHRTASPDVDRRLRAEDRTDSSHRIRPPDLPIALTRLTSLKRTVALKPT
jgi:hypothetical protein